MSGRHLHLQSEDLGSVLCSPQASAGRKRGVGKSGVQEESGIFGKDPNSREMSETRCGSAGLLARISNPIQSKKKPGCGGCSEKQLETSLTASTARSCN